MKYQHLAIICMSLVCSNVWSMERERPAVRPNPEEMPRGMDYDLYLDDTETPVSKFVVKGGEK